MPMLTRTDLEKAQTLEKMKKLLDSFTEDREIYPSEAVHKRQGLIKDLIEEYGPLYDLSLHLNADSAYLTHESNKGPDGIIILPFGEKVAVQITVANQSHQAAMGRELLSQGKPIFATTRKIKNSRTKEVKEEGRCLTTHEQMLRFQVQEIMDAVKKKIKKFHAGTDALLVSTRISVSDLTIAYKWRQDLTKQIFELGSIPYKKLYIANGEKIITIFDCYHA